MHRFENCGSRTGSVGGGLDSGKSVADVAAETGETERNVHQLITHGQKLLLEDASPEN